MRSTLNAKQRKSLKTDMRARARQLREEIRQALLRSDTEQYVQVANEVRDLEDESFADLIVDVNLAEIDRDLEELRALEAAIRRLNEGNYGVCEHCGLQIEYPRLKASPAATRCFDCQSSFERTHYQNLGHTL